MSITPADIQQMRFKEARKGYDPGEVDVFLETLAAEVDAMLRKIADLKGRLTNAEQQLAQAQSRLASQPVAAPALQPQQPQAAPSYGATEQQISAALITAQQSADRIVGDAKVEAGKIRDEAESKAREVIRQALEEKKSEIAEIERLKASREEFRASYMKLIQHFQDDANATFPEAMLVTPSLTGSAQATPAQPAVPQKAAEKVEEKPAVEATVLSEQAHPFGVQAQDVDVDDLD